MDHIKQGLKDLKNEFTRHPTEMHQSYGRHLVESLISCGVHLSQAVQFLFHGCFPFCFPKVDARMEDSLALEELNDSSDEEKQKYRVTYNPKE